MRWPHQVTFDCADIDRLVEFWSAALDYVPEPPPAGFASWKERWLSMGIPEEELGGAENGSGAIVDPAGQGPRIWFQQVPEPKTVKNRLHLDFIAAGGEYAGPERKARVEAEVERLIGLGATRLSVLHPEGSSYYGVVLADPEGNEFCLT